MQVDMHFFRTYVVARVAGFMPAQAKTIATAIEFVDEAVLGDILSSMGILA